MSLCGGVLLSATWTGGGGIALLAAGLLAAAVAVRPSAPPAGLVILLAWGLLGFGLGGAALFRMAGNDVRRTLGARAELVRVELVLEDGPRRNASPASPTAEAGVWIAQVVRANGVAASGRIRLRVEGTWGSGTGGAEEPEWASPAFRAGDRVTVVGRWNTPEPPSNPGQSDPIWAERVRGVAGTVTARSPRQMALLPESTWSPSRWLGAWRQGALRWLDAGFTDRQAHERRVLAALLLGHRDGRLSELFERFELLGASHHLVVSGTHLTVVGGFVFLLLRAVAVSRWGVWLTPRRTLGLTLLTVGGYGLAVVPGEPVTRSVLLSLLLGAGVAAGRPVRLLNLLGLCALVMVVSEPAVVFRAGFQLTFGVVWALCAATPALAATARLYRDRDVEVADRWLRAGMGGLPGGVRAGEENVVAATLRRWAAVTRAWAWGTGLTVASAATAAWMMSVPILACHTGQVAWWGALASVALSPAVFIALVLAALKLVLSAALPAGSGLWAWGASGGVWLLETCSGLLAWMAGSLGGASTGVRIGGWTALALGLLMAAAVRWGTPDRAGVSTRSAGQSAWPGTLKRLAPGARRTTRRTCTALWFATAVALTTVPLLSRWMHTRPEPGLRLTLLSVGSAQCAVLEHGDGSASVFDVGTGGARDVVRDLLEPLFAQRGVNRLRRVVLSHGDADHAGGAATLLARFPVGELVVGEAMWEQAGQETADRPPTLAAQTLACAQERGTPVRVVRAGDTWHDGDLVVDVLHPPEGVWGGWSENDASLVLRLQATGRVVLLCGDVERAGQAMLLERPGLLRCDVLVVPHHGADEPTLLPLVSASEASWLLVSDDRTPTASQNRARRALASGPRTVLRTSEVGAVTVHIGPTGRLDVSSVRSPSKSSAVGPDAPEEAPRGPVGPGGRASRGRMVR